MTWEDLVEQVDVEMSHESGKREFTANDRCLVRSGFGSAVPVGNNIVDAIVIVGLESNAMLLRQLETAILPEQAPYLFVNGTHLPLRCRLMLVVSRVDAIPLKGFRQGSKLVCHDPAAESTEIISSSTVLERMQHLITGAARHHHQGIQGDLAAMLPQLLGNFAAASTNSETTAPVAAVPSTATVVTRTSSKVSTPPPVSSAASDDTATRLTVTPATLKTHLIAPLELLDHGFAWYVYCVLRHALFPSELGYTPVKGGHLTSVASVALRFSPRPCGGRSRHRRCLPQLVVLPQPFQRRLLCVCNGAARRRWRDLAGHRRRLPPTSAVYSLHDGRWRLCFEGKDEERRECRFEDTSCTFNWW